MSSSSSMLVCAMNWQIIEMSFRGNLLTAHPIMSALEVLLLKSNITSLMCRLLD